MGAAGARFCSDAHPKFVETGNRALERRQRGSREVSGSDATATSLCSTPQPDFSVPHPVMIGLPRRTDDYPDRDRKMRVNAGDRGFESISLHRRAPAPILPWATAGSKAARSFAFDTALH
jgi:hypothetical protein